MHNEHIDTITEKDTQQKRMKRPMILSFGILIILVGLLIILMNSLSQPLPIQDEKTFASQESNPTCSATFSIPLSACNEVCRDAFDCANNLSCYKTGNNVTGVCRSPLNIANPACPQPFPSTGQCIQKPYSFRAYTVLPVLEPADGWCSTAYHAPNPIRWDTGTVRLVADDMAIYANGKMFYVDPNSLELHSDPGSPTYTTLEASWQEHGVEMRWYIYFSYTPGDFWKVSEMRVYNGKEDNEWIYLDTELTQTDARKLEVMHESGHPVTASSIIFTNEDKQAYIFLTNFQLLPFLTTATPYPPDDRCHERPACLNQNPPCNVIEPYMGWCEASASATPTPTRVPREVIPNAPFWFNMLPRNLKGFLEQLYLVVFVYKRKTNYQHLLRDIVPLPTITPTPTQTY